MKAKKDKSLKKLKTLAKSTLVTLRPHPIYEDRFRAPLLSFKGYTDLFSTIASLINVSILVTQEDCYTPPFVKFPFEDIRRTLELASKLMPFEEGEFLDEVYRLLAEKEK
ncbi:hypothetical protein ED312_11195 [Sinomicrobium pectinilyticum]|uniref:Uncharacterized protein n=1 Tax=Sinomicrobium pectinilyticum TaxID=1084421 RepID=A0A3N0EFW2_SINP1|nr:hypothetical protein [Sinomicrobium pectinilyticum]RNL86691.1 hypothetical protein ED312_11195 [Sinomicrobium pectinilyticum]